MIPEVVSVSDQVFCVQKGEKGPRVVLKGSLYTGTLHGVYMLGWRRSGTLAIMFMFVLSSIFCGKALFSTIRCYLNMFRHAHLERHAELWSIDRPSERSHLAT